jgi:hypothetical protein
LQNAAAVKLHALEFLARFYKFKLMSSSDIPTAPSSTETVSSAGTDASVIREICSIEEIRWNSMLKNTAMKNLFQEIDFGSNRNNDNDISGSMSFHEIPIIRKRTRSITASDFNISTEDEEEIESHSRQSVPSRLSDLVLFLNDDRTAQTAIIRELEQKNEELVLENDALKDSLQLGKTVATQLSIEKQNMLRKLEQKDEEIEQKKSHITLLEVLRKCQAVDNHQTGKSTGKKRLRVGGSTEHETPLLNETQKSNSGKDEGIQEIYAVNPIDMADALIPSTPWLQQQPLNGKQSKQRSRSLPTVSRLATPSTLAKGGILDQR